MSTRPLIIGLTAILLVGCFPHVVPVEGTWTGEAARLRVYDKDGHAYDAIRLIVPPQDVPEIRAVGLRTNFDPDKLPPEQRQKWEWARRIPVLVNSGFQIIDGSQVKAGDQLRVGGTWPAERVGAGSSVAYESWPVKQETMVHLGLVADNIFNITCGANVEVRVAVPTTGPATSTNQPSTAQSAAINLMAKLASADQVDLSWTAFRGAASYIIQLSEDGIDYHETLDVGGTDTSASLVGLDGRQAGQRTFVRVLARDSRDRIIGESNVCVIDE